MKFPTRVIAAILIVLTPALIFLGCGKELLQYNIDYVEYYFDSSRNAYIKTGRTLVLNESGRSFTMSFANFSSITGSLLVEKDINGLVLSVDSEAFEPFLEHYSGYLNEAFADTYSADTIEELLKQIHIKEQLYYSGKHIFSSRSMKLVKSVSETQNDYSTFEGVYDSVGDDSQYLFKNGKLYLFENGASSEYAYGTYSVNEGYVTVTRIDESGEPLYKEGSLLQIGYLYTTLTFPEDFAIVTDVDDEDYNQFIDDSASTLAGKKIAVLVNNFYLAE